MPARINPPAPPYLGPAKFTGGAQSLKPLRRIVIHGTVSPCERGGARKIARYFKTTVTRPSSAHYVVDPGEVVQVVGDHTVAFHAPPNTDSIGVEHCDPVAGPASRWADANHRQMLARSAELVAQLCLAYDVPIRRVGPTGLKLGRRGITGHIDVGRAWRQTSHTDPGDGFPWKAYIGMVKDAAEELLQAASPPPPVKPIPPVVHPPVQPSKGNLTLVTSNIKNNPDLPRPQVRADMDKVRKLGGVVMWQEIGEQDDRDDLATTLPLTKWTHVGLATEVPISFWTENWHVVTTGFVKLHGGKRAVSPDRYVTWAEVRRKGTGLPSFIVMNTHWVSGAFTAGKSEPVWRLNAWKIGHAAQSQLVADFNARGLSVIGGGDFNRKGEWTGFTPAHRWLMHGGLDHLWCSEADNGVRFALKSTGTLGLDDLFTDHPARWVQVSIHPPLKGKVHS